jgi:hypothetical protein
LGGPRDLESIDRLEDVSVLQAKNVEQRARRNAPKLKAHDLLSGSGRTNPQRAK